MSLADLLEEFFESPEILGVLSVSGVIGTWGGPARPARLTSWLITRSCDVGDGQMGSWGFPEGGMAGATTAMRKAAKHHGATVLTGAEVQLVSTRGGRVSGVVLKNGDEIECPIVVHHRAPKDRFLEHLNRDALPASFVDSIELEVPERNGQGQSCPGSVAGVHQQTGIRPPGAWGNDGPGTLARPRRGCLSGRRRGTTGAEPFRRHVYSFGVRPHPGPGWQARYVDVHSVGTSYLLPKPAQAKLEAYADRIIANVEEIAPGFTSSILHRQIIGPYEMEHEYGLPGGNVFHGELSLSQMFHMRPAPGWANFRTPVDGLYHASSATHGGGGVTGIPALQVVKQIGSVHRRARL